MGFFKYTYDVVQFDHPTKGILYAVRRSNFFKKDTYYAGRSFLLGDTNKYWRTKTTHLFEEYLETDKDRIFDLLYGFKPKIGPWIQTELVITKGAVEELLTK